MILENIRCKSILLLACLLIGTAQNLAAQDTKLVPPSQDVAQAFVLADSGFKPSGSRASWSQWYRLAVGQAPKGYTLSNVEFWLTGDHSCGIRAECREIAANDRQVIWEFRLQGENEGTNKPAYSEGHIRATYRPSMDHLLLQKQ